MPSTYKVGEFSKAKSIQASTSMAPYETPQKKTTPPKVSSTVKDIKLSASVNLSEKTTSNKNKTSTTDEDVKDKRMMAVKTTIKDIWKPAYLRDLFNLVTLVNKVVTHTYALSKHIFLHEVKSPAFRLYDYINKDFFVEVFLSLVSRGTQRPATSKEDTSKYRTLIYAHHKVYCKAASYTPLPRSNAQQMTLYECTKIKTAYVNNIKAHSGRHLRGLINKLCNKNEGADKLRKDMESNKASNQDINAALRKNIYEPCNQIKLAVQKLYVPVVGFLGKASVSKIKTVIDTYPKNYALQKDSVFYDVYVNPENNQKAFMKIN